MRSIFLITFLCAVHWCFGQVYFPVKVENKWGLINADGNIFIEPKYDAIGEFKHFGYAVMQRNGGVGLLNQQGTEIILPKYDDIKVLSEKLVAVFDAGQWMVVNLQGKVILPKGYESVQLIDDRFLAYMQEKKWGIIDTDGRSICKPTYKQIELEGDYFSTTSKKGSGLMHLSGTEILPPEFDEIKIYNQDLFFHRKGFKWGATDGKGNLKLPESYDNIQRISANYLKLIQHQQPLLYSIKAGKIIAKTEFDNYYPFSTNLVLCKKVSKMGLMDGKGDLILRPNYDEIQAYTKDQFRVKLNNKWGVRTRNDKGIIPFEYQYIAPLKNKIAVVKQNDFFGIVNVHGEQIIPVEYSRVQVFNKQVKAYKGETLTLFYVDGQGKLKDQNDFKKHLTIKISGKKKNKNNDLSDAQEEESNYSLEKFEWFYVAGLDRWGLRRLDNGAIQIKPVFDWISIQKEHGFTIVGMEHMTKYDFEFTSYRFDMAFGMVNNDVGLLVTKVDLWDIRIDDFDNSLPTARCVFNNGRHGLIDKKGNILRRDYAYIGNFSNGLARVSINGDLSGKIKTKSHSLNKMSNYLHGFLTPNEMIDHTNYDRSFEKDADLICENCLWGYMDTIGQLRVEPKFDFAKDFLNEVGIVEQNGKWGMVDASSKQLIECLYDEIHFLENTENKILRVYSNRQKYGLIDTLGNVRVSFDFDKIGAFRENRLAVQRNNRWGFVNSHGQEIIPCRFARVTNFSEGFAAVKLKNDWGMIDKQGDTHIDFRYNSIGNFHDGLAWAQSSKGVGYINKEGKLVIAEKYNKGFDFQYKVARVVYEGKVGLIDRFGRWVAKPRFSTIEPFNEHKVAIAKHSNEKGKWTILDVQGNQLTYEPFSSIEAFSEGLAAVKSKDGYGFIDTTGRLVIPCEYSMASDFKEGRAAVKKDGHCGYIDQSGKVIVELKYSKCLDYNSGKAVVYKGLKRAGLIDIEGKTLIEPSINQLLEFQEGRGLVRDNQQRFYYITEEAKMYDGYYKNASGFQHGVAVVESNGKWGIINQKGIEIIPPKYDKIEAFEEGYARVRIKKFSGLTNLKGELIVQPDYEYISYAGEGLFRVEQGDKIGYFDAEGNWVWGLRD